MFPFVSGRENGGAVLGPEGPAAVPGAVFPVSDPGSRSRYRRMATASTTISARITDTAPIPLRDNVPLFIPRPPCGALSMFDAHDSKSDARMLGCDPPTGVHHRPPCYDGGPGRFRLKRNPLPGNQR